jgi:hypothetical protein
MAADRVRRRKSDAGGQTIGHFEPPLDLAQNQQNAVGGQTAAAKAGDDFLPGNR